MTFWCCSRVAHMERDKSSPDQARPPQKRPRQQHDSPPGGWPPRSGEGVLEGRPVRPRVAHPDVESLTKERGSGEVQRIVFSSHSPTTE